jgi:hypothetical protein
VQRLPTTPGNVVGGVDRVLSEAIDAMDDDDVALLMGAATTDGDVKLMYVHRNERGDFAWTVWFEHTQATGAAAGVGLLKRWKR